MKELDPRFRPRWYKIEVGLWIFAFLTLIFSIAVSEVTQLAWILTWGLRTIYLVVVTFTIVHWGSQTLLFLGYWFPRLGVWGARFERWLEKDLEWSK